MSKNFTLEGLQAELKAHGKAPVKPVILDQSTVSGVGNIYADESLHMAKIHPRRLAGSLKPAEATALYEAIPAVMKKAISYGGTSFTNYVNSLGKKGNYLQHARVFRKQGQPCPVCGTTIEKIRVGRPRHPFLPELPESTEVMIFFFYGPNSFTSRRKMADMVQAYIKKNGNDLGVERMDGEEADVQKLNSALQAAPFLSNSRLVIIEYLGRNKTASAKIEDLIKQVPESTVAVFYETDVDQRTTYFKTLKTKVKAVKFEMLDTGKLVAWIKNEVERLGGEIENPAVQRLLDIVGDDQWRLEQEILKLFHFKPHITKETVEELVVAGHSQTIFDLVESVAGGNTARALKIYRDLLDEQANEVYILSMIAWQLRNLLLAKTAGPVSPAELASRAKMSPYVAGKVLNAQRNYSQDALKKAFLATIETDYKIKTGEGEPDQLVERLIYQLSTAAPD